MVDYRPLTDDEAATFHEFVSYAFRPQAGPEGLEYDPEEDDSERNRLGARRGVFDGDEPLAVCQHYWFETTLRGETVEMPGLSAVASPPEHRRGGNVRRMLAASLEEYRDRDAPICALWPFEYGFYRQYGWDTCNRWTRLSCSPETLSFAAEAADEAGERRTGDREDAAGRWRRLDADDWDRVDAVYRAEFAATDLAVHRDEDWWRYRRFEGWEDDPFVYGWFVGDELRAYIVYEVEDGDDGRELQVWESGALDFEAYLRCLDFCHDHDSQVGSVTLHEDADPLLLDVADAPDDVEAELETGPMVRVVDVVDALEAVPYPGVDEARVVLDVSDPMADWNDGRFELAVADGRATCGPTDADPDVTLDVAALSQLVVGYRPVSHLQRTGRIDGGAGTLSALFPPREPLLWDFF
ncbi:GNAT family N-acetyltransferase [Haloarchaeobius sp. HRN-SO-5]|uniref:GNAT family N-acetyltransferase n=1 Tax=Haloarchaeobius sp. HRN-SO-5 TaxID=3446118 RepID=UPI003EBA41D1